MDLADMGGMGRHRRQANITLMSQACWSLIVQLNQAEDKLAEWFPGFLRAELSELARVKLPAGWQNDGDHRTLHQVCAKRLLLVELGKKIIGDNAEAALRAAARMHAMKLRLTSAVDAVAAWFQSLEHYTKGDLLPLTPHQLGNSPGALPLYTAARSGWRGAFIPCDLPRYALLGQWQCRACYPARVQRGRFLH